MRGSKTSRGGQQRSHKQGQTTSLPQHVSDRKRSQITPKAQKKIKPLKIPASSINEESSKLLQPEDQSKHQTQHAYNAVTKEKAPVHYGYLGFC